MQVLVFSDEFNNPNRSFAAGQDRTWQALDLFYAYGGFHEQTVFKPEAVSITPGGALRIQTSRQPATGACSVRVHSVVVVKCHFLLQCHCSTSEWWTSKVESCIQQGV